jgi:hypothetical protein
MKEITRQMIKKYGVKDFDFMGYDIKRKQMLSFHHLIVPHRHCKQQGLGEGYVMWNGAILVQDTSHEYLHIIEHIDFDVFCVLTSEMIDMNVKGYLDIQNLRQIKDVLLYFEREHDHDRNKKGRLLIKREYTQNRFNWDK